MSHPAENPTENPTNQPAETPAAGPGHLAEIGQEILSNLPAAEEHFLEKLARENAGEGAPAHAPRNVEAEENKPARDRQGYYFDPEIHVADEEGSPKYTKTGLFELKRGRKRSEGKRRIVIPKSPAEGVAGAAGESAAPAAPLVDPDRVECEALAELIDGGYWTLAGLVFDPKVTSAAGRPEVKAAGKDALATYLMSLENRPNLPAWAPLAIIYGGTTAAMVGHPETKPKRKKLKEKLALWWLRRKERKRKPGAPVEEEK